MVMPTVSPEKAADPTYNFTFDLLRLQPVFAASLFWVNAERIRHRRVLRYRNYYDGDHDFTLNSFMMDLLRIKDPDEGMSLNMMPTVVDTKADRCIVQAIDAVQATNNTQTTASTETEAVLKDPAKNPSAWIQELMEANRFDILQGDVHQAAIRDGDSFVMATYDDDKQQVCWTFEEAFDGYSGMLAYYPSRNVPKMAAAIKIWQVDEPGSLATFQLATRVNIYYPDRIERYITQGMGALAPLNAAAATEKPQEPKFVPYIDPNNKQDDAEPGTEHIWPWTDRKGDPLGIPVIHFRNAGRHNYGVSEMRNAISPQNALNRFHYSSIMTAEFTAFSILVARGHQPPSAIVPGMIYKIGDSPLENGQIADLNRLAGGDMKPILEALTNERHLIAEITRTPSPDLMAGSGSNKSGEMLKQLEIGLLGKVRQFQVRAGVSWEMLAGLSWKIQVAFSTMQPPAYKRFIARWRPAEIRDKMQSVQAAVLMDPIWGNEQTMKQVAGDFDGLDEDTIAKILARKEAETAQQPTNDNGQGGITDMANPGKVAPADGVQQGSQPVANKPAITGKRLPPDQAFKVKPIHPDELAAVGAMHRNMVGK